MTYRYGDFTNNQIKETKQYMRKKIFFLLLCVDPSTSEEHKNVNIQSAFNNVLHEFGGLNDLLFYPTALVRVMSLLNAALIEYENPDFDFKIYRKLVLDAGAEVNNIKEV